ncbi:MAG: glycosyltransferase family 4 protein [Nitriliruptoraceae bacterium]
MRVLWVTNDLPPRAGGIERFVENLLLRVHPQHTLVVGPPAGLAGPAHDERQPYQVVRLPGPVVPTPAVRRTVIEVAAGHRPDVIVLGATWPLGELAPALSAALGVPVVGLSHGLEAGLVQLGGGHLVARATRGLAAMTTISEWTERQLEPHVRASRVVRVPPGVDTDRFRPDIDGAALRERWGVAAAAPLVGSVSRLVPRKGLDVLLAAWPTVLERHPTARLAIVGDGPMSQRLTTIATRLGLDSAVILPGTVDHDELPASYAAFDVFAMPCRTRWSGLDVEGLGMVYLEAQACGVPTVAGRSGGAPEAVLEEVSGSVVDGRDTAAVAAALLRWLDAPAARRDAALAGRRFVEQRWSWPAIASRFHELLDEVVAGSQRGHAPEGDDHRQVG